MDEAQLMAGLESSSLTYLLCALVLQRMDVKNLLKNYHMLKEKVDGFCRHAENALAEHMACRAGCHGCCRHFSLFPVEAVALAVALRELPVEQLAFLRERAKQADPQSECPALSDGLCTIYNARPLICRTHGLPIATTLDGIRNIDHCPLNFQTSTALPGGTVLELDRLNETLVVVNALFLEQCRENFEARLWISEALLLDVM